MFGLGYQELLIILVIVLILFGANRLPELAPAELGDEAGCHGAALLGLDLLGPHRAGADGDDW